jgi:eukaryotic-like serine/threonine-protein kinase
LIAGRYRLTEAVGRGGMGEVYRATDVVLGRDVAVKVMLPIPETLAAAERFRREARASGRLRHPHVVAVYDFGEYGGAYYLAMELVHGRTVAAELKRNGPLPAGRAEQIVRQAAAGLAAAHAEGLVHRDIKPDNLLLTSDGSVKVADFGIVRFLHDATTTLTSTGQIVGTSRFLSPERVLGKAAEPASDVYALGCVLYQLTTGRPPFVSDSPASVMFQHVQREPTPPSELRPGLPRELEALTLWMLAKDPASRPTAVQIANGVRAPEVDLETTMVLSVRRKVSRPVLAGIAATAALAISATAGILSATSDTELPPTADLAPSDARSTAPPVPKTPAPTAVQTVTQTTTAKPSVTAGPGPARPKAPSEPRRATAGSSSAKPKTAAPRPPKRVSPGSPTKEGKPGPAKPKKPKT